MRLSLMLCITLLFHTSALWAFGGHTGDTQPAKAIDSYRELTADEQQVLKLLQTYASAMEQRSVDLAEQAVIPGDFSTIESGYANWTWEDFKKYHLSVELQQFHDISYKIELLTGEFQGDMGFAIYRYTASGRMQADGPLMSITGLATAILENTDKGWRIHHIHSSTPRQDNNAAHQ